MTHRANPALALHQRYTRDWVERIMNQTVIGLYDYLDNPGFVLYMEHCWYIAGEGVTVWRESDGRSPVEPVVPGDYHGPQHQIR